MRRSRISFTVRRLIYAVTAVAVLLGGVLAEQRRRVAYTELLHYHAQQLEGSSELPDPFGLAKLLPEADQSRLRLQWAFHKEMRDKYSKALSVPFWYVPDDPPGP